MEEKERGGRGGNIMNIILKNNTNSSLATPESEITRLSKICVMYRIKRYVPPSKEGEDYPKFYNLLTCVLLLGNTYIIKYIFTVKTKWLLIHVDNLTFVNESNIK
jgi:hypothetical protein